MDSLFRSLSLSTALALVAATNASAEDFKISSVLALTGPAAYIGTSMRDGIQMAVEDINKNELLGQGNTLVVSIEDDAGDKNQSLTLLNRAANDSSVDMVLGPSTGAVSAVIGPAANDLKMPVFALTNIKSVVTAGPWGFIMTQLPGRTVPILAGYVADVLKPKECAVITISDSETYVNLAQTFVESTKAKGVAAGSYNEIKSTDIDFSALAVKLVDEAPACIHVSTPAVMGANIIIQLRQAGLDPATYIIGHNSFASPQLVTSGSTAVEGVYLMADWLPGGANEAGKAFNAAYLEKFGREADNWAPVGYSQTMIAADALKRAGSNPPRDQVREALTTIKDVPVLLGDGVFNWDEERMPSYGMSILTIKDGQFTGAPK